MAEGNGSVFGRKHIIGIAVVIVAAVLLAVFVVAPLVGRYEPARPVASQYHWGEGFQYGATAEVFAVATVTDDGIEVWWYHDGWASPWLDVGWYYDECIVDPESGLPHSGDPTTWNDPVKGLFEAYFPGVTEVRYARMPVDVADVPQPHKSSELLMP